MKKFISMVVSMVILFMVVISFTTNDNSKVYSNDICLILKEYAEVVFDKRQEGMGIRELIVNHTRGNKNLINIVRLAFEHSIYSDTYWKDMARKDVGELVFEACTTGRPFYVDGEAVYIER